MVAVWIDRKTHAMEQQTIRIFAKALEEAMSSCETCNNWVNEECQAEFDCRNWEKITETEEFCNFCGKSKSKVARLFGNAGSYICGECVEACQLLMKS